MEKLMDFVMDHSILATVLIVVGLGIGSLIVVGLGIGLLIAVGLGIDLLTGLGIGLLIGLGLGIGIFFAICRYLVPISWYAGWNPDSDVRQAAKKVLAELGDKKAIDSKKFKKTVETVLIKRYESQLKILNESISRYEEELLHESKRCREFKDKPKYSGLQDELSVCEVMAKIEESKLRELSKGKLVKSGLMGKIPDGELSLLELQEIFKPIKIEKTNMSGTVCMVTGANSGMGKATALGLAKMGATVVMVCRNQGRGEAAQAEIKAESGNDSVDLMLADLSSQKSIRQFVKDFKDKYQQLHVLINNVGVGFPERFVTEDGMERTFAVNYLAPFLLTNLLLDVLKASAPSRIVNVSSGAYKLCAAIDFDDLQSEKRYGSMRAYSHAKLALNLFTYKLARRLKGTGVTVNCLFPGARTRMTAGESWWGRPLVVLFHLYGILPKSQEEGAETSIYLASSPEVEGVSGKYFGNKKEVKSSRESYNESVAQRLWQVSGELTKLKKKLE